LNELFNNLLCAAIIDGLASVVGCRPDRAGISSEGREPERACSRLLTQAAVAQLGEPDQARARLAPGERRLGKAGRIAPEF
jgi:hypothetical protein